MARLVIAPLLLLAFSASALAQGNPIVGCYAPWLKCQLDSQCRSQLNALNKCVFDPSGVGQCVAKTFDPTNIPPKLLSLNDCALRVVGKDNLFLSTELEIEGVTPDKIWPYYRDLTRYPQWTTEVAAKCASRGCDPTKPLPGDMLIAQVRFIPRVPRVVIPMVKVTEVRDGTKCVGLTGRCGNTDPDIKYRISWGPDFPPGPVQLWGYEHFFDMVAITKNGVPSTRLLHHEYYKGILAPLLYPVTIPLLRRTVTQQNYDMSNFALSKLK